MIQVGSLLMRNWTLSRQWDFCIVLNIDHVRVRNELTVLDANGVVRKGVDSHSFNVVS
jgi:hypothetical protein